MSFIATVAGAAEWRLVDITGPVRISIPGSAPSAGRQNQILPTGATVTTAGGGRATLDNGDQRIVVAPHSRLTVQPDAGGFTRIAQDLGAAMFKVDKKAVPHFRVDTPLLAAIVKGTTFTVMVEGTSDAVSVAEGLVEVRSNLNAVGSDVAAGATGTVMRDAPGAVRLATPASTPAGPAPAPVNIAPIDYKAASDGLIDIAPAVAQAGQDTAVVRAAASAPTNSAVGASVLDSPTVTNGGSIGAAVSQIASIEAGQRETATQVATAAAGVNGNNGLALGVSGNGNGAGNNGNGNGNGGSSAGGGIPGNGNGNTAAGNGNGNANGAAGGNSGNGNNGNGNGNGGSTAVADAGGGNSGNGNGNGNSGNGNSGNGNGNNGNGSSTAVADAGSGNSGNGKGNGNSGNSNANGNSGNGNANGAANGNSGNGNSGNGNGNGGGLVNGVVVPVVNTVTDIAGGNGNSNSGNPGNSGNGNANGAANGNSGNGNNGNGNGNGGSNIVTTVTAPVTGLLGGGSGNGNSGNGNSGNSGNGNGNSGG